MKKFSAVLSMIALCCLSFGCSQNQTKTDNPPVSTPTEADINEETESPTDAVTDSTLPILKIDTVNQEANALDFVKLPVAPFVSEQIATWTPNYKMPPAPYYESCKITLSDADENVLLSNIEAQVKVRGNWTTTYDKKGLRIKFTETQNMLGLNEGAKTKNWVLLAEYKDASMLRNKSALAICREILDVDGLYASDAEFVEVYINGNYWGIYLLAEMQQVNPDRVAITEPLPDYADTDIGYFMEFDGYYTNESELNQFFVDYADNAELIPYDGKGGSGRTMKCLKDGKKDPKKDVGITIKSDIYSQEQHDFIESYVNNVYEIMYNAAYNDKAYVFNSDYTEIIPQSDITPQQAVENVVNVESLADMYIISELTCDADIYWSSFYMSADFGAEGDKKLTFEAPWDFDSAMGNKDRCADGQGFYAANIVPDVNGGPQGNGEYETINPWLAVLAYEDWYQEIIKDKWTAAYDSGVFERGIEIVENDKTAHAEAFERNYAKWDNIRKNDSFAMELSKEAASCKTHEEAADFLAEWLESRVDFLNEQWHR